MSPPTRTKESQATARNCVCHFQQRFGMHKELLCATSPFFKAALEGKFEESIRGEVILEDVSVETLGLSNEWMYTNKIREDPCQEQGLTLSDLYIKDKPSHRQLLDGWLLGDYLPVTQLQNYIADKMKARYTNRPVLPFVDFVYLYEKTQPGSPMRKLMVDMSVWKHRGSNIKQTPRDMAADLG
ncbi:hypothetical protein VC83_00423 [Pseudogymnoascus destructans]|uniref:BTB domain-containing protein n=2 Tax=Pseudogymnoascus destructans TaxID=655981 RepID=L8G5I0_PSED2|nr:uncharacterized protein VC83_00423 [Pseudogymnoascus destructans]ELR08515.1 hypothetical protein GMDG_03214 [Pseudogymnoascus destructans 20631-21]OAF63488.1 hypothetical protein VC83_00423 [Pseudogymnoascus destructans]